MKHGARVFKNPRSFYALLVWVKEAPSKADRHRGWITGAPIAGNVPQWASTNACLLGVHPRQSVVMEYALKSEVRDRTEVAFGAGAKRTCGQERPSFGERLRLWRF